MSPRSKHIAAVVAEILALIALVAVFANIVWESGHEWVSGESNIQVEFTVSDIAMKPENYVVSDADLQNPELPTGCEATALSILLRMNGVNVTKFDVADAMPKGTDFVNQFWGDPYSTSGWACMAPCSVATANMFLADTGKIVVDLTGTELSELPAPCAVWVTIGMEDAIPSKYEKDGYVLMQNPHCLVVTDIKDDTVSTIDPLKGCVEYSRGQFEKVYKSLGSQAIYIE